jgi:exopolysaccharide biosynthesis protein
MEFLVEVVSHKINTWNGILSSVQVNVYLGFKYTLRAKIACIKIAFRNQINAIEDPDPVRIGNGSSIAYIWNVYRENRNSLIILNYSYARSCGKAVPGTQYSKYLSY